MTSTPAPQTPRRRLLGAFVTRPRLLIAVAVGVVVWGLCLFVPSRLGAVTSAILAWDAVCLTFIVLAVRMMWGAEPARMRAIAATQDQGQGVILTLTVVAAAASIWVIAQELSAAQADVGLVKALRVALVFATVAASWFMVQLIFALHYAHEYYAPDDDTPNDAGGLLFPGGEEPDYWDFVHFSLVIGVASQTADIAFTSKALRRIGTVHGVVAFTFNTVVLALTINLLAGLFQG
ncbi:DUF1345 domain-containing protein [Phenylobacterium sp.]|uniref:DUF1345 domain-containing protein n=1 Tax=Phenylobacterium sp. TaxID=1871053 RepID=UPI00289A871C|nr:DUF1345 domain-containing protein [Phenylobacterium sp.]